MHERIDRFTHVMGRIVPDAVTTSVILLVILLATALILGDPLQRTMDAYYQGLWMLLPFTMQMTLIITLSTVLGSTPFFRRGIMALARVPRTENEVIAPFHPGRRGRRLSLLGTGMRGDTARRRAFRQTSGA